MNEYKKPTIEIINFNSQDIIRTSANNDDNYDAYDPNKDYGHVENIFGNPQSMNCLSPSHSEGVFFSFE